MIELFGGLHRVAFWGELVVVVGIALHLWRGWLPTYTQVRFIYTFGVVALLFLIGDHHMSALLSKPSVLRTFTTDRVLVYEYLIIGFRGGYAGTVWLFALYGLVRLTLPRVHRPW